MEESRYFLSISRPMRRHFFQKIIIYVLVPDCKECYIDNNNNKTWKKEYFHGISDRNWEKKKYQKFWSRKGSQPRADRDTDPCRLPGSILEESADIPLLLYPVPLSDRGVPSEMPLRI